MATMPPEPYEYQGHDAINEFIAHAFATRRNPRRLIPTRANAQPAFGQYAKTHAPTSAARARCSC